MADNTFKTGDNQYNILRKMLAVLGAGLQVNGQGSPTSEVIQADATKLNATVTGSLTSVGTVSSLTSGNVGGFTKVIHVQPTVNTAAYSAGNTVGGIQTLTNAVRVSGGTAVLESIHIIDRANQKAAFDILIFESNPAAATTTDHAAFVWSTDDLKLIGHVAVSAADYVTVGGEAVAHETSLGIALQASGSANLYVVAVTSGAPDYVAATDLQFTYGLLQD
jgi:hypothetical protein